MYVCLVHTVGEQREVLGVGRILVAMLPLCQGIKTITL